MGSNSAVLYVSIQTQGPKPLPHQSVVCQWSGCCMLWWGGWPDDPGEVFMEFSVARRAVNGSPQICARCFVGTGPRRGRGHVRLREMGTGSQLCAATEIDLSSSWITPHPELPLLPSSLLPRSIHTGSPKCTAVADFLRCCRVPLTRVPCRIGPPPVSLN